MVGKSILLTRL